MIDLLSHWPTLGEPHTGSQWSLQLGTKGEKRNSSKFRYKKGLVIDGFT